ncbi:MAG: hypothetical protein WA146_07420 [Thiobacillus sp.]
MNTDTKPTQLWQLALVVMIAALFGVMLSSGCEGFLMYLTLVAFVCVVAPMAVFLIGYAKHPLASNLSRFSFGGFILFGAALAIGGFLGIYRNESFLSGACSGANIAARFTLGALKVVGSAL